MRPSILARMIVAGFLLVVSAAAQEPPDPAAAAREHLKEGFALRKAGQCAEALPHFLESFRLMPQPKALLNMADCEEHVGHFIDAEEHWVQARVLAEARGESALAQEAADRLAELAPRIPRLTIALASGAPPTSHELRDGVDFASTSLGVPLPCNAGSHTVEVRADGYEPKVFEVALTERDTTRIDVEPGPRWQPAELPLEPSPTQPDLVPRGREAAPDRPRVLATTHESARAGRGAALYLGLGAGALGLASLGLGTLEGLAANSDHASALAACKGACATSTIAQRDQAAAQSAATWANVGFVAGGVLLATSIALLVIPLIPLHSAAAAASTPRKRLFRPIPLLGRDLQGMGIESEW